ncbi:hypothetical protein SPONL_381 [uncultured Candidatus Thioglobus sp.]|nr:hypothetical protein SPONL_381 [uncultured Candidatus Thioglobus sp.]
MLPYQVQYPFYYHRFKPSAQHKKYSLNAQQIYNNKRSTGISGYVRIYNEEDFLAAAVESHLPFFDELILVHDPTCSDKSPQIAQALADKYPDKIKYFIYAPEAFKLRTKAYKILPTNHPNSFVNYSNFALSKTTKNIVAKVDADHIAIKSQFEKIILNVKNTSFMQDKYYTFSGINLWQHQGEILIDPIIISGMGDIGFHPMMREKKYYQKGIKNETFPALLKYKRQQAGILYFHLKNMRQAIEHHSYRGLEDSIHQQKFKKRRQNVEKNWVNWDDFLKKYRQNWLQRTNTDITTLPNPNDYLADYLP